MNADFQFFLLKKADESIEVVKELPPESNRQEITQVFDKTLSLLSAFVETSSKLNPYLKEESKQNMALIVTKVKESLVKLKGLNDSVADLSFYKNNMER